MGKENQPSFLARLALKFEEIVIPTSAPCLAKKISRRELFKYLEWSIPLFLTGGSVLVASWYLLKLASAKEQLKPDPQILKDLKLGPKGEKLFFWGPQKAFSVTTEGKRINFVNTTNNLFLAINYPALEAFLREENIDLKKTGQVDFLITSNYSTVRGRQVFLAVGEKESLQETNQDLSATIGAVLSLSQQKGDSFWKANTGLQLMLIENQKKLFLKKFDPEKVPSFSLWREVPN